MADALHRLQQLIRYTLTRKGPHGLHSPFVYELMTKVIRDKSSHHGYEKIVKARKSMFANRNLIETVDFGSGAGSKAFSTYRIRVNKLAKMRTSRLVYYKLLHRLAAFYKPEYLLEFGTSTGLSAVSLASGNPQGQMISMEGCASVANIASGIFERLHINNIEISIGNFNHSLAANLERLPYLDLVFFDGNHRKEPTLDYFHHCLAKVREGSIFIFDDIHWSPGMNEAWDIIRQHPEVPISVDLYQFGIIFFRKGIEKQHFVLSM